MSIKKRINLSFCTERDEDMRIFDIINQKSLKTDFVIKAVDYYIKNNKEDSLDKQIIKDALREVLLEEGIGYFNKEKKENIIKQEEDIEIPAAVFEQLNNM